MSVVNQINDAQFLMKNSKYESALTLILLAIAASSRRMFPKGTLSIANPKNKMGDGEAFTLFLGGRLQRMHNHAHGGDRPSTSSINIRDKIGNTIRFEEAIYSYYRCFLIHEGGLSNDVEFVDNIDPNVNRDIEGGWFVQLNDLYAGIFRRKTNKNIVLTHAWLEIFIQVVIYADCNNNLFGRYILDIFPKLGIVESVIEEFINAKLNSYNVETKRSVKNGNSVLFALKKILLVIKPSSIVSTTDGDIQELLQQYNDDESMLNRAFLKRLRYTGMLRDDEVDDISFRLELIDVQTYLAKKERNNLVSTYLTQEGLSIIKEVADSYEVR